MNFLAGLRTLQRPMYKMFHSFQEQITHGLSIISPDLKSKKQPLLRRWNIAHRITQLSIALSMFGYSLPAVAGGTTVCQSPYGEIYGTTIPNGLSLIYPATGVSAPLTTSPYTSAINGMATDHVSKLVYYDDGNAIYAWNALTNQHIVITNNFSSFLPASYTSLYSFTTISSGGAAFYNGSLYVGIDGNAPAGANPNFEIFKVDFVAGSNGQTIQKVTPLNIAGNSGGGLVRTNEDWGDFTISDTGIILAMTNRYDAFGNNLPHLWNYNLNTNQYTNIGAPSGNHQLAKSGDGKIWALFSSGAVQEVLPNGTYTGPISTTISASDGGECVVGNSNVGDRVWVDTNGNGLQDAGEPSIAGVSVSIYRDINKNGVLDAGEPLLATQVTNASGNYNFTELLPHDTLTGAGHNDFIVQVTGGVPANYTATTLTRQTVDLSSATQTIVTVDFGYKPNSDLTITKTHTGNFAQGQTGATYTLTATNSGPGPTSGLVSVVDTLPTGLTATAISGNGWTCTLATRTCTRSDVLAAGSSYPVITVTVNVAANAAASLTNSAAVSGGGEVTTTNNTATDPTTIDKVADLTITKTHVGNFTQGQTGATYTLTAKNSGTLATVGTVSVTDTLPAGLTATAISGNGWTCTLATLTCTRSDALAIGASYPVITLTVNVATNAATSLINSAAVSGGGEVNTANDTATNPTTINSIADLTVTKTHTGNFTQGQTGAAYTLSVTNSGTLATVGTVSITDTLPTGLTATAISGNGWTCTLATLTCTRSTVLAAGASYPVINLTVSVAANAPASLINSTTVSGGGQIYTANDTATDPTAINGVPDLTIAKTHTGSFIQGQTGASYSLTVTNSGTAATSGTVTVVDTLPTGLTATAASGNGWTCSLNTPSAGKVQCTRSDVLAVGISYPAINLTVNVAASVPVGTNSITNSASVSGGGEINAANNSTTDPTTVAAIADLRLSKTANPTDPTVGSAFNYTITVTNDGPSTATNVQVTDRLPPSSDVSINSASISKSQGSTVYNAATPNIVWTVGTLAPNTSATLTIPATRLLASFTANVAEVTASDQSDPDSTPGNNVAGEDDRASVTVPSQSVDLAVTKSVNNPSPNVGQNVTFTITVTNPSSSSVTATGVGISDPLPAGLTYQSNTPSQGSYTPGTGAWSVGSLSPGTTATLTITAKVNASGTITNTAQLSALDQIDPDPSNNSGNATVTPASSTPNLRLVKRITALNGSSINTVIDPTTTPDPNDDAPNWPVGYLKGAIDGGIVRPSDEVEYTIYFLSDGDSPVRHVQLCDLVPVNSTFIPTAFNGLTPTDGGLSGADTGIALSIGSAAPTVYLTNVGGDGQDRGQFLAPNAAIPASCGTGSNTHGAVVVDVVTDTTTPSNLPNATVPGTPTNSHGFIRFWAKVN
jgi:uncharacterized repeat protein (TIGR01451 family)